MPTHPSRAGPRHPSPSEEHGSATVEVAVLLPLVLLLLMLVVQAGIYFHTRAVAITAARQGVDAARIEGGSAATGKATAERFLDQNGAALRSRRIVVDRNGETAEAQVSGRVASVLFGIPVSVTVDVAAPVEQVIR